MAAFSFDDAIVPRFVAGDPDALAGLYDANSAAAYALALSMCGSERLAAEAVSRTFLELWERRASLDLAGADFAVHFHAALRRHCRGLRPAREVARPGPSPLAPLRELPPDERDALSLVVLRGLDEVEASGALGATPGAVRRLVRYGLERLSELLPGEMESR